MEFYHVLNRGVDKRAIVIDDADRLRFVHSLFVFNDTANVDPNHATPFWHEAASDRNPLVRLHLWCLMGNHYHLLLSPVDDKLENISAFMKKLNMGYAKYFNDRYVRTGALWQGKYRKIIIDRSAHYLHIPYYIHLNPLDFEMPEWRKGGVRSAEKALEILRSYRWSSHLDYLGEKNFASLIDRSEISDMLGSRKNYEHTLSEIIQNTDRAQGAEFIEK